MYVGRAFLLMRRGVGVDTSDGVATPCVWWCCCGTCARDHIRSSMQLLYLQNAQTVHASKHQQQQVL
jgi:hypothetical protein